jgi:hypothetical protein
MSDYQQHLRQQQRIRRGMVMFTVQGATTFDPSITVSGGAPTANWIFIDDPGIGTLTGNSISQAVGAGTHRVLLGPLGLYPYITTLACNTDALTGSIPAQLANLPNVTVMNLYDNLLTGSILATFGNLTNLTNLILAINQLSGAIPTQLGTLTNLTNLQMNDNLLTSSIPTEIGNLTNLLTMYLQANQLSGTIPATIGNLTLLRDLYLNANTLSDIANNTFNTLASIRTLRVDNNAMIESVVDKIVIQVWTGRASYTWATPALNVGGTNANPSGTYAAPPGGGMSDANWNWNGATYEPLTGLAYVYDLVNDVNTEGFNKWTVTY